MPRTDGEVLTGKNIKMKQAGDPLPCLFYASADRFYTSSGRVSCFSGLVSLLHPPDADSMFLPSAYCSSTLPTVPSGFLLNCFAYSQHSVASQGATSCPLSCIIT